MAPVVGAALTPWHGVFSERRELSWHHQIMRCCQTGRFYVDRVASENGRTDGNALLDILDDKKGTRRLLILLGSDVKIGCRLTMAGHPSMGMDE